MVNGNQQGTTDHMEDEQQEQQPPPLTPEQQALNLLLARIEKLEAIVADQKDQLQRRQKEKGEILKPKRPESFGGETSKMNKFFAELDTYFGYFPYTLEADEDQVLFAANCLVDTAAEWFRPILADYNLNKEDVDKMKEQTQEIFADFKKFKKQLERSFGTMNEEREAERELRFLRQKGALSKHTTTFLRLLTKVNWTEETKKEVFYNSVKPEVKDELFKENRSKIGFVEYTQKAIDIDNRNFERSQERKMEKHGYHPTSQKSNQQPNQGKKRDDYIAKDNGTRPGRMDIDTIHSSKFKGTCNFCGKPGHKEADCRSKQTCEFCGKKGHKEANCYTKKNKDKTRVDAIAETPHNRLHWSVCDDDLCLVHKEGKDDSGYYPKKARTGKTIKTARIDTLNFYEQALEGDSDLDADCEHCGVCEPRHTCNARQKLTLKDMYECDSCGSKDPEHDCLGCPDCGSTEGFQHSCEKEFQQNMEAMYELFKEENEAAENYYKELEDKGKTPFECKVCGSRDFNLECEECHEQGAFDALHVQNKRQELSKEPPQRLNLEQAREQIRLTKTSLEDAYNRVPINDVLNALDENCGNHDWKQCNNMYCQIHVFNKLSQWHAGQTICVKKTECHATHFLDCAIYLCGIHSPDKSQFYRTTRKLTQRGYDFNAHVNRGQGNKTLIKKYHRMIKERNHNLKCQWCKKYQVKTWQESPLDNINIDSVGYVDKKLLVKGYINQDPVTIYVDSGADRNLITPNMVTKLQLPYTAKKRPTYVSSIVHPEHEIIIKYETDHLPLTIAKRTENIKFDIMDLDTCDIMLGHPWLEQSNPLINWKTKEILWNRDVTQEM